MSSPALDPGATCSGHEFTHRTFEQARGAEKTRVDVPESRRSISRLPGSVEQPPLRGGKAATTMRLMEPFGASGSVVRNGK